MNQEIDARLQQWDDFVDYLGEWAEHKLNTKFSSILLFKTDDIKLLTNNLNDSPEDIYSLFILMADLWAGLHDHQKEMSEFLQAVRDHIENYAIPRYPKGKWFTYSEEYLTESLNKYIYRWGQEQRGDERLLDIKKMAHYLCGIWSARNNATGLLTHK